MAAAPPEEARQPTFGQSSTGQRSAAPPRFQNSSGTVLGRDASTYGGGSWTPGQAPSPPATGSAYNLGGVPPSTLYGTGRQDSAPGSFPQDDMYSAASSPAPSGGLGLEKNIYFGLNVLGALLSLFGSFSAGVGGFIGSLVSTAIGLFILWFVLNAEEVWAKWACGGCTVLGWLSLLGVFMADGIWSNLQQQMPIGSMFAGAFTLALIIRGIWDLWFLSILWRDVQRLQGNW